MRPSDLDPAELQRLQHAAELLAQHAHVITNALHCHAEQMDTAAQRATDAYEAGHSSLLIANQGYRMAAELLTDTATKERDVANLIDAWKET
ncbi:hypothetical protein [Nonomuraea sp. CA-141351]|uniref:hypothetical protein n=1 Tax=Nonomuraea sp. CA-141351 TaxID=3239996 RepID=UPI003D8BF0C2